MTATGNGSVAGSRIKRYSGDGALNLRPGERTFDVTRGSASVVDLTIQHPDRRARFLNLVKQGNSLVMIFELPNTYTGETRVVEGELRATSAQQHARAQRPRARRLRNQPRASLAPVHPEHG